MARGKTKEKKSKLKAIRQNKVVIKIIVNSAICCAGDAQHGQSTCVPQKFWNYLLKSLATCLLFVSFPWKNFSCETCMSRCRVWQMPLIANKFIIFHRGSPSLPPPRVKSTNKHKFSSGLEACLLVANNLCKPTTLNERLCMCLDDSIKISLGGK